MKTVQARLDAQTEKTLEQLVDRLGVSPSIVVRRLFGFLRRRNPKHAKLQV